MPLDVAKDPLGGTITPGTYSDLFILDLNYFFSEMSVSLSTDDGATQTFLNPEESVSEG